MKLRIRKSTKETDLINACRRQSARAQQALYEKYAPEMLALCKRYVRGDQEAEDVMIYGFMTVFAKIDRYEGRGSFEGWMKRIMINEALGWLRRNKSMYIETDIEKADREPDYQSVSDSLEVQDLMKMIAGLPVGYRTVFNLYAIEGYSHKEIAAMLGINENTSKSQLSRARAWLKKKILESERVMTQQNKRKDEK